MTHLLPKDTFLGKLKVFEVYDDFMGPKCFSLKNQFGQFFLAYWGGDYEDYSRWLYVLVTSERLDELTRQARCVRSAYVNPENKQVFDIKIYFEEGTTEISTLQMDYNLSIPPDGMLIDPELITCHMPESEWGFKLRISKKSKKHVAPERSVVTRIMDSFSVILEELMQDILGKKSASVYPLEASFGSFEVSLKTSHNQAACMAVEKIKLLVSESTNLEQKLLQLNLDPYRLQELSEIIRDNSIVLTLSPKTSEFLAEPFEFGRSGLNDLIETLASSNLTFVDSSKIPQANNLQRVLEVLSKKEKGEHITYECIDGISSNRQLDYHFTAAICLGLMNKNHSLTAAGKFVCLLQGKAAKYQFLYDRFESTEFGWSWMQWAGVNSISDLDPSTSKLFISQCVRGLKRSTAVRRANTLSTWLKDLQPYKRDYGE
ncbi:DUF6575 domain-containing protein [Pseudoalteromonas rubra]|uniref:DUF6575 domain-containing protein n=1 Tax=Pseudoalteromonas rubra TaxID=43658 RepID=UPI000F7A3B16|nr:DUF6575 domain-containing protein [Pseudoalteromonas rubra]